MVQVILFPFDAILVSALEPVELFAVLCKLYCVYRCALYTIGYCGASPMHRVSTVYMYPHVYHLPTRQVRARADRRKFSLQHCFSGGRLCFNKSGTHSTRCACKRDELICVRVRQSNRAVAAATRVSFQRRPIANVRRDFGTVRFVASRIDLRFSSVAIGHMIS